PSDAQQSVPTWDSMTSTSGPQLLFESCDFGRRSIRPDQQGKPNLRRLPITLVSPSPFRFPRVLPSLPGFPSLHSKVTEYFRRNSGCPVGRQNAHAARDGSRWSQTTQLLVKDHTYL